MKGHHHNSSSQHIDPGQWSEGTGPRSSGSDPHSHSHSRGPGRVRVLGRRIKEIAQMTATLAEALLFPARCLCTPGTDCGHHQGPLKRWPDPERPRVPRQARRRYGELSVDLLERDFPHWRITSIQAKGGGSWILAAYGSELIRSESAQQARERIEAFEATPQVWPVRPYLNHPDQAGRAGQGRGQERGRYRDLPEPEEGRGDRDYGADPGIYWDPGAYRPHREHGSSGQQGFHRDPCNPWEERRSSSHPGHRDR